MEKWDLYNAKREKSGITVCRGEIIPKGLYHLSVSAWIVNQQGQYLLSQRHPKKQYPLYWECTQHHKLKEKMERNLFAGSFHCVKI